ncbi:MAG: hypothetical protein AAF404_03225 [Pseudomonadota bacterium]
MRFSLWSVLMVLSASTLLGACSDDGLQLVDPLPGQGQHTPHTDIEQGIWPPQPLGMTGEQAFPASARDGAQGNVVNAARGRVLNNPVIRQVLGDDYVEFDGSLGDNKGDLTASFVFYSYSSNETIEANLLRSGEVTHTVYPAHEFQPTEHATEVSRAIDLANTALTAAGFETTGLTGTAMLAFPPAGDSTDIGQQYYPERIMYVTFGIGDGELPAYRALANLSTGEVTQAGVVQ